MLSPSLFGGRRVLVLRAAQDARKDLVAALLAYAKNPDPDVHLIVVHAGGAKGKAFADGLRAAGAQVVPGGEAQGAPRPGRLRPRRDPPGRRPVHRRRGRGAAGGGRQRPAGTRRRLLPADRRHRRADRRGHRRPLLPGPRRGQRLHRRRRRRWWATCPAALEALRWALHVGVDPVPIADALADGIRTVARVSSAGRGSAYQLAGSLGMPAWKIERAQRQSRGWTPDGLVDGDARRRRLQRRRQGRRGRPGVRA